MRKGYLFPRDFSWIENYKLCCVNNVKGTKPNTPSESAKYKKRKRYVTLTDNKLHPTLFYCNAS